MDDFKLDTKDEKILAELDQNARIRISKIARKTRLSKSVVNYRIRNLEKGGVIKGYYAVIDAYKLGYHGYRLYLKLQYAEPEVEKRIMQTLMDEKSTWWVGTIKGKWNVGALVWVKSEVEFAEFWHELLSQYRDYIEESRVCIYYGLHHFKLPFTKKHLKERATAELVGGSGEKAEVDETDILLLKILATNARASLLEMASRLSITPGAVSYRLKKLVKNKIVVGFRVIVDMPKLGFTYYKLDFNLSDFSELHAMEAFAKQHESIFYLNKTVGGHDYEIEAYTQTMEEFFSILNEIRKKFKHSIKDYDFFTFSEITKLHYIPIE